MIRITYLHCNACRMESTPSGRRLLAFPDKARPAEVSALCEMGQEVRQRQAGWHLPAGVVR